MENQIIYVLNVKHEGCSSRLAGLFSDRNKAEQKFQYLIKMFNDIISHEIYPRELDV